MIQPLEDTTDDGVLEESELLLEVVRSLVRKPEQVRIETIYGQSTTVLTIIVDPSDRGHVIGKDHRTIDAITHLFSKSAAMEKRRVLVQMDGPDFAAPAPTREKRRSNRPPSL
jgi:predicted RNA-binding protein YlqC (UPF0109 family)